MLCNTIFGAYFCVEKFNNLLKLIKCVLFFQKFCFDGFNVFGFCVLWFNTNVLSKTVVIKWMQFNSFNYTFKI